MINLAPYHHHFRRAIPLIIFIAQRVFTLKEEYTEIINNTLILIIVALNVIGVYGLVFKIPFKSLFRLHWHYSGFFEWSLFIIVYLKYLMRVIGDNLYSLNYVVQCVSCGGWLYEIPFFHPMKMFFPSGTIINTQIISIFLLLYLLYERDFKVNKKILLSLFIYVVFSIHLFIYPIHWISKPFPFVYKIFPNLIYHVGWIIRIPTLIMLFTLSTGLRRNRK